MSLEFALFVIWNIVSQLTLLHKVGYGGVNGVDRKKKPRETWKKPEKTVSYRMYVPKWIISELGNIHIALKPWNLILYSQTARKFSFWHVGSLKKIAIELYKNEFRTSEGIWASMISETTLLDVYIR